MADELYDEDYHVPFPSWLLVKKDCVARKADGTAQFTRDPIWLLLRDTQGGQSMPVFTDEHTALSYCEATDVVDEAEMIAAQDAQYLVAVLEVTKVMKGVTEVVFDPKSDEGITPRVYPIDYVIERLRKGLDL
jgi:hypothetical protein